MKTYKTSEVAKLIGIHPNTVRLYEKAGLIPKPERQNNGYRIFTDLHIEQFRLARLAFQMEVLQNGLRKKAVQIVKTAASCDFSKALVLAEEYLAQIRKEHANAEEAVEIVTEILAGESQEHTHPMKRREVSRYLGISMDALRNWEMNGLLTVNAGKMAIAYIRVRIYRGSKSFAPCGVQIILWSLFCVCSAACQKIPGLISKKFWILPIRMTKLLLCATNWLLLYGLPRIMPWK